MSLPLRSGQVLVLGYGQYETDQNQPMTRRDGSPVEFVEFRVDGEERTRRYTLAASVNGSRVAENTVAELLLDSNVYEDAAIGRSGRPYVRRTVKYQVTGFASAKS